MSRPTKRGSRKQLCMRTMGGFGLESGQGEPALFRDLNKVDSKEDVDQKLKLHFFLEFCDWHLVIAFFLKRQTNHEARYEKS